MFIMTHEVIHIITNLGDSAVTGSLALLLVAYLWTRGERRAAFAVVAAFAAASLGIGIAKIFLYSRCEPTVLMFNLRSPSGHTAISVVVYGMLAIFLSSSMVRWRFLPYLAAVPFVMGIAVSRVLLQYHSRSDVLTGLLIGLMALTGAWYFYVRQKPVSCRWGPFLGVAALAVFLLCGIQLPAESLIDVIASFIRGSIRDC